MLDASTGGAVISARRRIKPWTMSIHLPEDEFRIVVVGQELCVCRGIVTLWTTLSFAAAIAPILPMVWAPWPIVCFIR